MMILDVEATFVRLDNLRERMTRLEQAPDAKEWQYTRLLIRTLTQVVAKSRKGPRRVSRKVRMDAPAAVGGDWQGLVEVLLKKGIKSESRKAALKRAASASL